MIKSAAMEISKIKISLKLTENWNPSKEIEIKLKNEQNCQYIMIISKILLIFGIIKDSYNLNKITVL